MNGNFSQDKGALLCQACSGREGGCLNVRGAFDQSEDGSAEFDACGATVYGGGMRVFKDVRLGGFSVFQNCTSGTALSHAVTVYFCPFAQTLTTLTGALGGGCLHTSGPVDLAGHANFTGCSSKDDGGGLAALSIVSHSSANVIFTNCTTHGKGGFVWSFRVVSYLRCHKEHPHCAHDGKP